MFKDYKNDFDKLTIIKNKKKQNYFKKLKKEEKEKELKILFYNYLINIEKKKLFYFILASNNQNEVIIVKAPRDNKAGKKYLGYEWSTAKGHEGIKLYKDANNKHITLLYDETNRNNKDKVNYYIKKAFENETPKIPETLTPFLTRSKLINMLDFKRTNFNKQISLTPKKTINFKTKWDLIRLEKLVDIIGGSTFKTKYQGNKNINDIPFYKVSDMNSIDNIPRMKISNNYVEKKVLVEEIKAKIFPRNTIIFPKVGMSIHTNKKRIIENKGAIDNNIMGLITKSDLINPLYLLEFFNAYITLSEISSNANPPSISADNLKEIKIPLPPKDIQEKIVEECRKIDKEKEKMELNIKNAKKKIENLYQTLFLNANKNFRLGNSSNFDSFIGKRVLKEDIQDSQNGIPVYSANVFKPFGYTNKKFITDFSKPSILWGIDGDWMVNIIEEEKAFYPTDHCGVIRIKNKSIHPKYLAWSLKKEGEKMRFSRSYRASTDRIRGITIKVPSIQEQTQSIKKIEKQEKIINEAKMRINNIAKYKDIVLDKYL